MIPAKIFWWVLTVLGVSFLSIILSQQRALDPFQGQFLRLALPLENAVSDISEPVADFWEGASDHGGLVRENEKLRAEIERLQAEVASREDASQRIQELERLLQVIQGRTEDTFVVGDVIAQDPSTAKKMIAVNRGTDDGISEGMVVMSEGGSLVGTVSQALSTFAWIQLITDPDSVVNSQVQLAQGQVRGVVQGDIKRGLLLQMVPPDFKLAAGALVTTSGLGGNYPTGLLIGSVRSFDDRPQALFQQGVLEPAAPLTRLRNVLILTSFEPLRLRGE